MPFSDFCFAAENLGLLICIWRCLRARALPHPQISIHAANRFVSAKCVRDHKLCVGARANGANASPHSYEVLSRQSR